MNCKEPGCDRPVKSRGYCANHYNYKRLSGELALKPVQTLRDFFWGRVEITDSCWLWSGGVSGFGYGHVSFRGLQTSAHRLSYRMHCGAVPSGMVVCHKCDNPRCVNPSHLFVGTQKDNIRDMVEKGRMWTQVRPEDSLGTKNPAAKITEADVLAIRNTYATGRVRQKDIAAQYGLDQTVVSCIVLGKSWPHVGGPITRAGKGGHQRIATC